MSIKKTGLPNQKINMKSDEIRSLFAQFEAAASELEGVECCSAREMQNLLGYSKWENFEKVIQKAKDACRNAGEETDHHFPDVRKMIKTKQTIANHEFTT